MYHDKNVVLSRPGLMEIFAAVAGIIHAGIDPIKKNQPGHPLARLGTDAAKRFYSFKEKALSTPSRQDEVCAETLRYLWNARRTLEHFPDARLTEHVKNKKGGTVGDLTRHIDQMLEREWVGSVERPPVKLDNLGGLPPLFKAPYLPTVQTHKQDRAANAQGGKPRTAKKAHIAKGPKIAQM